MCQCEAFLRGQFSFRKKESTGANPTIASYNASAVKAYIDTSSLARFENKIFSSTLKKRCSCKFKSCRIGSRSFGVIVEDENQVIFRAIVEKKAE
jgi:hypothetical protein